MDGQTLASVIYISGIALMGVGIYLLVKFLKKRRKK